MEEEYFEFLSRFCRLLVRVYLKAPNSFVKINQGQKIVYNFALYPHLNGLV